MNELDMKLNVLFQNEEFKAECENIHSVEELQKLFATHDVEMSIDQVTELCIAIGKRAAQEENGELSEEDLDDVAGGFGVVTWTCIGLGVLCLGAFGLGVYNGLKG